MTAITVGHATATVQPKKGVKQAARVTSAKGRKGFLARAWDAFIESRMRQAEREIALHRHLLPGQFQQVGDRLARSEKDLPFAR